MAQAARGSAGGLTAFSSEERDAIRRFDLSVAVSMPQFWQSSPGSWGRNTFSATIFHLLLFIKLSFSFGGLKQTWTESGKTNSSETRRRLSLAKWLFVAFVSCWSEQPAAGSPGPPP